MFLTGFTSSGFWWLDSQRTRFRENLQRGTHPASRHTSPEEITPLLTTWVHFFDKTYFHLRFWMQPFYYFYWSKRSAYFLRCWKSDVFFITGSSWRLIHPAVCPELGQSLIPPPPLQTVCGLLCDWEESLNNPQYPDIKKQECAPITSPLLPPQTPSAGRQIIYMLGSCPRELAPRLPLTHSHERKEPLLWE